MVRTLRQRLIGRAFPNQYLMVYQSGGLVQVRSPQDVASPVEQPCLPAGKGGGITATFSIPRDADQEKQLMD